MKDWYLSPSLYVHQFLHYIIAFGDWGRASGWLQANSLLYLQITWHRECILLPPCWIVKKIYFPSFVYCRA